MGNETDSVLWYNVGVFGDSGFAVPNFGNDTTTLNATILELTDLIGRNLFALMKSEDVDLRTPPSINTLLKVHQLYIRAGQLLQGRAIPDAILGFETRHVSPAEEVFRVYPIPYFKVRNAFMKSVASYTLMLLSDCMQHSENRKQIEITERFSGMVGQYLTRIYARMAIDLFGKTAEETRKPGFVLLDADFKAYAPGKWYTGTEMVDTVPPFNRVFTEDQMRALAEGIPVTQLPNLGFWPGAVSPDAGTAASPGAVTGPIFPSSPLT